MRSSSRRHGIALLFLCLTVESLPAQSADAGVKTAQEAAMGLKNWLTTSAAVMNDSDYLFRPTAEVRSFGQLMAHVADKNYEFCAVALGVERPVRDVEHTRARRAEIQQALSESFAFCDTAYAGLAAGNGSATVLFNGRATPILSMLLFLNMHNALHYGNAVTYLRLRGKVPPSPPSTPSPGAAG